MDKKGFFRSSGTLFVVKNLLTAVLIAVVLIIVLFFWLRRYTRHGVEVDVPNTVGLYLEEALPIVHAAGLKLQITDSIYSRQVPLGTIVEQTPVADSHAKQGRTVYIVINAHTHKQIPIPDLHDISYRQAAATLRSIGIQVNNEYEYEPSEFKDLVLDIKVNGRSVAPGERLDEGTTVTLVVGFGKGTEMVPVPNLIGKTLQDARSLLLGSRLIAGNIEYDETTDPQGNSPDGKDPIVYTQSPAAGEQLLEGSMVNLKLSTDIEKALTSQYQDDEDDFF